MNTTTFPLKIGVNTLHANVYINKQKPPIVLVHGLGLSGDSYSKYLKLLIPFYSVYAIDLPGFGKTPKPSKALSIEELANVVAKFILTQGIKKPIIVGQSFGCQIVAEVVAKSPSLFSKVILLAPTSNKDERTLLLQACRLFQDIFQESLKANSMVFINYLRMGLIRYLRTSKYMIDNHIENNIKKITLPLLVVNGSKDRIAPKSWTRYLANISYQGLAVEISGAPHLIQYAKPEELFIVTERFLK